MENSEMLKLDQIEDVTERDRVKDLEQVELKPCPFCGGRASLDHNRYSSSVMCIDCYAASETFFSDFSWGEAEAMKCAIERWNQRI